MGAVLATVLLWRGTTVTAAVLPPRGSTAAQYRAHYRPIQRRYGSGCGTSHGTTVARYYRNPSGTTALVDPGSPCHKTDELQKKQANPELPQLLQMNSD